MKTLLVALSLFIGIGALVEANDVQSTLTDAAEKYKSGAYEEAETAYYRILNNNVESPELYYNLGNAHYKQQEWAASIWAYKSGLRLAPDSEDLQYNLRVAEKQLVDDITPLPTFFLTSWWHGFVSLLSPTMWAIGAILCMWIGGYCMWQFLLKQPSQRSSFATGMVLVFGFAVLMCAAGFGSHSLASQQEVVVYASTTHIKSEPNTRSSTLFSLHEGTAAQILSTESNWFEIRIADGNVGWVPAGDVKVVGKVHSNAELHP